MRALRQDIARRITTASRRRRDGRIPLTGRHWALLVGFALTAVLVAVGLGLPTPRQAPSVPAERVAQARAALAGLHVVAARLRPPVDYQRSAFGQAWTDHGGVGAAGNGCDTRNDILRRDLAVTKSVATTSCPAAVAAGRLRSPYSGREIAFARGAGSAQVQIDHVVPLAYAWDMGAWAWPAPRRMAFANDPANLLAVDGPSNQAKSDLEPGRWMPALRGFWCQYAIGFLTVSAAYRLAVDEASRRTLAAALGECSAG
ncbi:HNH endonuclease family protein [Gordonia alkaliphila]|uniref:HNH endonuclease family protein n=1 Tax=Gordonia alkaliphila TaxID=1053547 RepID=UPI001FF5FF67|nr:HNH endonuclease family protein [Gordonia alkaliphila]MCK0437984.1 HNH endonuclease family protein [Gordonia alkaliphila]